MANKLSPLTHVNVWPTRKLPQQRFDDEVKKSMDQMSKMIAELNNPFIPTINEISGDVNVCVENIELIQAAPGHAATAQQKAQEAAASATKAQKQATIATQKATAAAASAAAAAQSEQDAHTAQSAAETAQAAAEASKNAAATSANTATQKANAAAASATTAQQQATLSTQKANAAATSASQAATSATKAQKQATIATQKATAAQSAQEAAEAARDEAQNIAGVGPATPGAIGFVKPDSKTTVTDGAGALTAKDIAISGDLSDLASTRGQIGNAKFLNNVVDFDDLINSGVYWVGWNSDIPANAPPNEFANSGAVVVVSGYNDDTSTVIRQVYFRNINADSNARYMYVRHITKTGKSNWITFVNDKLIGDGIHVGSNGVISVPEYDGATASKPGTAGLVPPATAAQRDMALLGSGEYGVAGANKVTLSGAVTGSGTVDGSGNIAIVTTGSSAVNGVLTKKGTRTTNGTWTISGLTAYKPVFFIFNQTNRGSDSISYIYNIKDCYSPIKDDTMFNFYYANSVVESSIILIPKTTSISCDVYSHNITAPEFTAWQ